MVGTIEEIIKYLFNQEKTKQFEIKEYKKKRSNDANAYCWVLCDKIAKELSKDGTVITKEMLNMEGQIDRDDMRLQEYNMVVLPTPLLEGESVDIRLRLPSGEDYIVLSKKFIEDTNGDTIWIKVSEDEILTMSNAIVEAYIMEGAYLYATPYTDAGMQNASTPTFVATNSVISLMNADPNITTTAKAALASRYTEEARRQRETINQALNNYADNAIQNVEGHVEEEIQKMQAARQEFVEALGM